MQMVGKRTPPPCDDTLAQTREISLKWIFFVKCLFNELLSFAVFLSSFSSACFVVVVVVIAAVLGNNDVHRWNKLNNTNNRVGKPWSFSLRISLKFLSSHSSALRSSDGLFFSHPSTSFI
jgi:hypothetical protein